MIEDSDEHQARRQLAANAADQAMTVAELASGTTGLVTMTLLAASAFLPFVIGDPQALVSFASGMGLNALSGWVTGLAQRQVERAIHATPPPIEEQVVWVAKELQVALDEQTELADDIAQVLEDSQAIQAAVQALGTQTEVQHRLLMVLEREMRTGTQQQTRLTDLTRTMTEQLNATLERIDLTTQRTDATAQKIAATTVQVRALLDDLQVKIDAMAANHRGSSEHHYQNDQSNQGAQGTFYEQVTINNYGTNLSPSRTSILPPSLTDRVNLIGRGEMMKRVITYLLKPDARVCLYGLPGVGKTALVREITRDIPPEISNVGVLYAELGKTPDIREILRRWIAQCHGVPHPAQIEDEHVLASQLRNLLGSRPVLVVLDDVWKESLNTAERLLGCLPEGGRMLLSSRTSSVCDYMSPTYVLQVQPLRGKQSLKLLKTHAPRIVAAEPEVAETLAEELGLPLAIKLAAFYLKEQSDPVVPCGELLQNWRLKLHSFKGNESRPGVTMEELSVDAIIELSYDRLPQEDRAALASLSAFGAAPNSWNIQAMKSVVGDDSPGAKDHLHHLLSKTGLADRVKEGFQTHAVIHAFLASRQPHDAPAAFIRHVHFYTAHVRKLAPLIDAGKDSKPLDELDREYHQVRRALSHAKHHKPACLLAMAASLWRFWEIRSYKDEASLWLNQALAVPINTNDAVQLTDYVRLTRGAAILLSREDAEQYAAESRGKSLALGSDLFAGEAEVVQGILKLQEDPSQVFEAVKILRSAVERLPAGVDPRRNASARSHLGFALVRADQTEEGLKEQRDSVTILREGGYLRDLGDALDHLAQGLNEIGRKSGRSEYFQEAISIYEESLTIRRDINDITGIGFAIGGLAWNAFDARDNESARRHFAELLGHAKQVNDQFATGDALLGFGLIAISERPEWAAKLLGHVAHNARNGQFKLDENEEDFNDFFAEISEKIGQVEAETQWSAGAAMVTDALVAEVLVGLS